MPDLDLDAPQTSWQSASEHKSGYIVPYLPPFLRVGRLPSGPPYPELHWATLIAFSPTTPTSTSPATSAADTHQQPQPKPKPEIIFYSPHGIYASRIKDPSFATQHSSLLAPLHGLNPAWSLQTANPGIENGRALASKLDPRYWVPTHGEHLGYEGVGGVVSEEGSGGVGGWGCGWGWVGG